MYRIHCRLSGWLLAAILIALSPVRAHADGDQPLWRLKLPGGGTQSSCALGKDGTIYQGTFQGWFFAISPEGKKKWQYEAGGEIWSSPSVADDGTIYFGSRDRSLYALTPTGQLKWKFPTGAWVDSSPAIGPDGTVYFGSWDKIFRAVSPDGKLKWSFATSNIISTSPVIAGDGTICFGSHDHNFYALTPAGGLKWRFTTGAEIDGAASIARDGTIYFESTDGNLYALRPDGSELWRMHTGGFTASQPVLDTSGNLYLAANRDMLALNPAGQMIWRHPTEVLLDLTWAVAGNGTVYTSRPWLAVSALNRTNHWPPLWIGGMSFNLASAPNVNPEGVIYTSDGYYLYAFRPVNAAPLEKSSWPMWQANPQHTGQVAP